MFLGRHAHTVDAKGRLAIPARFREELAAGVVLTRGIDRCLALYPMATWQPLAEKVDQLPITDPDARTFRRMVFAEAVDLELDAQGRILLPPELRQYAEIDRDAYVVGVNTSIEIWSPARWDAQSALMENDGAEIAQRLATLL
jgi:MraZ protein